MQSKNKCCFLRQGKFKSFKTIEQRMDEGKTDVSISTLVQNKNTIKRMKQKKGKISQFPKQNKLCKEAEMGAGLL
jgi:hypothetical protein